MPTGVGGPEALVKLLADDEIAKRKTWAKIVSQGEMQFVGQKGASVILGGQNPEGKAAVTLYVAAERGDRVYVFTADGLFDDLKELSADLDTILNGIKPLGKAGPAAKAGGSTPVAGSFGDPGAGGGATSQAVLRDPAWGLAVSGLDASWRLRIADGAYVLLHDAPQVLVTISRLAQPAATVRRGKALKNARTGSFAGETALVVDGTRDGAPERAFWLVKNDYTIVVSFASVSFVDAEARHLRLIDKAIRLSPPAVKASGRGGFSLDLPFGVSVVDAPAPWRLEPGRQGAGMITASEPKEKAELVLRVDRAAAGADDPFYVDQRQFQTTCQLRRGELDERTVTLAGASEAKLYRCRNGRTDKGQRSAALMVRASAPAGAQTVHTLILAYYVGARGETPDGAVAYFLQSLRMGGAQ
jgi:hypothetical protein